MKNISLYEEIFGLVENKVESLNENTEDNKLSSFSLKYESQVPQLERMCYIMEEVLLKKECKANVYIGFQKLSRAKEIWDRFLQIADNVKQVYVFGENDQQLKPHPDLKFIYLPPKHKLIREWFLIIDQAMAKSMMVAYDLDGFGVHETEKDRNFKGVKSNNPQIVSKASKLLDQVIKSV